MLVRLECLGVYQLEVMTDMRKIIQSEKLHVCVGIGGKGYGDIYGSRENKFLVLGYKDGNAACICVLKWWVVIICITVRVGRE